MRILVTGGAGFIGSHFAKRLLRAGEDVVVLDKLTYSGNRANLPDGVEFHEGDIADPASVARAAAGCDAIVNFAAETHVDRSITNAGDFIKTDVYGTFVLLEAARENRHLRRFVQISTDEVYGSVPQGSSRETDELRPRNPYSASKAGADRLAYSYWATYNVPVIVTRASNNYGPNQFPEKIIPLFITNLIDDIPVPLYGDGQNERDWLHVNDHCRAVDLLIDRGVAGEVYNIGGGNQVKNVDLTHRILELVGKPTSLIKPVADRQGHDRRYSLDTSKLEAIGWRSRANFEQGLAETVAWYRENERWWRPIKDEDPEFRKYYQGQYGHRR
jgi:dTDP-glucose 4,6-dehydratase